MGWADTGVTVEAVIVITADRRGGAAPSGVPDAPAAASVWGGLPTTGQRLADVVAVDCVRGWEDREFPAGRRFLVPLSAVEPDRAVVGPGWTAAMTPPRDGWAPVDPVWGADRVPDGLRYLRWGGGVDGPARADGSAADPRQVLGQAVSMVAEDRRCTLEQAFGYLTSMARDRHVGVHQLAADLVTARIPVSRRTAP